MYIKKNKLKKLIEPFLHHFIDKESYEIFELDAKDLISYNRLDLIYKILFLKGINKHNKDYITNSYLEHIRAFNFGKYFEFGNPNKSSKNDFLKAFEDLDESININGFDENLSIIPLSSDGSILNGSHRVASCFVRNKKVKCIKLSCNPFLYDYNFFLNHLVNQNWLEDIILNYISESTNSSLALIWPRADLNNKIIKKFFNKIIYFKEIKLNLNGLDQLVKNVYKDEKWIGEKNKNYDGSMLKTSQCFKKNKSIKLIVFESNNIDETLKIKLRIREISKIKNHSIHTADTKNEAIRIARLLLNNNSINFLNNFSNNKKEYKYLLDLEEFIKSKKLKCEEYMMSYNSSLFIYGFKIKPTIRSFEIYSKNSKLKNKLFNVINRDILKNFNNDFLYKPENYFWFNNIKFLSIRGIICLNNIGELKLNNRILIKLKRINIDSIFHLSKKTRILTSYLKSIFKFKAVKFRNFLKKFISNKFKFFANNS